MNSVQPLAGIAIAPPTWKIDVKPFPISRLTTPGSTEGIADSEKPRKKSPPGVPPTTTFTLPMKVTGSSPVPTCNAGVGFAT